MIDAFKQVELGLRARLGLLFDLPIDKLTRLQIRDELQSMHHSLKFR
jgi:arsenate reductase